MQAGEKGLVWSGLVLVSPENEMAGRIVVTQRIFSENSKHLSIENNNILPVGKSQGIYKLYSTHWLYSSQRPSSFLLVSSLYWY